MFSDCLYYIKIVIITCILFGLFASLVFMVVPREDYNPCNEPLKKQVKPNDSTASSGYYETMPIIKDVTTSKKWL